MIVAVPACEDWQAAIVVQHLETLDARFMAQRAKLGDHPTQAELAAIPELARLQALVGPLVAWLDKSGWLHEFHECAEAEKWSREPEGRDEC